MAGTGRYKEAEEACRKGLELQPGASRFHTYLATLDILQNRPAQAMANAQLENGRFLARLRHRYGATSARRPISGRCCAQGFHRQGFERWRVSGRYPLRASARSPTRCSNGSILPMSHAIPGWFSWLLHPSFFLTGTTRVSPRCVKSSMCKCLQPARSHERAAIFSQN